ncbi:MAG: phage/plasmid replication protein, II/X family [Methylococcaceae bacterium]
MATVIVIDMLVLRCDFAKEIHQKIASTELVWPTFYLADLAIPLEMSIDADGDIRSTRHPWESIPSSYDSMAFKVFDHRWDSLDSFYVEIKASPAKIMQGHNVWGSSDIYDCSIHLMALLCDTYPQLVDKLDSRSWSLSQIDITYSMRAESTHESKCFINALHSVSYGQTKSRTGFDGTAYFGKKNSRLKKIKVYSKLPEVLETVKRNARKPDGEILNEVYTPDLYQFSSGLVRWEVSLYHRYFERLGISTNLRDIFQLNTFTPESLQNYWKLSTADLFGALKGQTMKILNNTEIKNQLRNQFSKISEKTGKTSTVYADSVYRTYNDIQRDGWLIVRDSMSQTTFDRHVKTLTDCGLSRAALQNMNGKSQGAEIIPFVRFIEVDFCNQFPENYIQPAPKHIYTPKPLLSLVA